MLRQVAIIGYRDRRRPSGCPPSAGGGRSLEPAKGWKQQDIAKRLGVSRETIRDWIGDFGTGAESAQAPERLPAKAELEAIAKAR